MEGREEGREENKERKKERKKKKRIEKKITAVYSRFSLETFNVSVVCKHTDQWRE